MAVDGRRAQCHAPFISGPEFALLDDMDGEVRGCIRSNRHKLRNELFHRQETAALVVLIGNKLVQRLLQANQPDRIGDAPIEYTTFFEDHEAPTITALCQS